MKFLFAVFSLVTFSSPSHACRIIEREYFSPAASKLEHYLIILPDQNISIQGTVYFLHGRGGDRYFIRDLGACVQIDRLATQFGKSLMIVAPDGGNSYWVNAAKNFERYRDLVAQEIVQRAETEFSLVNHDANHRILAGISMGGHGAIQISINSPGIFGAIGAHSPVFRTQEETRADFSQQFGEGIDYQSRDPFSLLLIQQKTFSGPVYLDMGGADQFFRNTINFQNLMKKMRVPGIFQVGNDQAGAHADGYWRYHLQDYFNWYFQILNR